MKRAMIAIILINLISVGPLLITSAYVPLEAPGTSATAQTTGAPSTAAAVGVAAVAGADRSALLLWFADGVALARPAASEEGLPRV